MKPCRLLYSVSQNIDGKTTRNNICLPELRLAVPQMARPMPGLRGMEHARRRAFSPDDAGRGQAQLCLAISKDGAHRLRLDRIAGRRSHIVRHRRDGSRPRRRHRRWFDRPDRRRAGNRQIDYRHPDRRQARPTRSEGPLRFGRGIRTADQNAWGTPGRRGGKPVSAARNKPAGDPGRDRKATARFPDRRFDPDCF